MEFILKINSDILRPSQGWEPRTTWVFKSQNLEIYLISNPYIFEKTYLRKHILEKYLHIDH